MFYLMIEFCASFWWQKVLCWIYLWHILFSKIPQSVSKIWVQFEWMFSLVPKRGWASKIVFLKLHQYYNSFISFFSNVMRLEAKLMKVNKEMYVCLHNLHIGYLYQCFPFSHASLFRCKQNCCCFLYRRSSILLWTVCDWLISFKLLPMQQTSASVHLWKKNFCFIVSIFSALLNTSWV